MELKNGLQNLVEGVMTDENTIFPANGVGDTAPIQDIQSLLYNNRYYMITMQRQLLNELYVEHGIVQTMIDQPVEDAFRGDIAIISKQLSDDDVKTLEKYLFQNDVYLRLIEAYKWARLFGGGGVIVNVDGQDPSEPFDVESVKKGAKLEFYSADRWELSSTPFVLNPSITNPTGAMQGVNFNFYGDEVNPSRVIVVKGKDAPALKRLQLMGWGMSEIERLVAPMNKIIKNQNVIYDLLDEAKIDVYALQDYQTSLVAGEDEAIKKRITLSNMLKSYLNALVMDKEDEYHQKQLSFSGLAEILQECRLDVAAALRMPVTKIFGMATAGMTSGDDDLENYNTMIVRDIRMPARKNILKILGICCRALFGFEPDDLEIEFPSLRILDQQQEELIKNSMYLRGKDLFIIGMMTRGEFYEYLYKNDILRQNLATKTNDDYYSAYNEYGDVVQDLISDAEDKELAKGDKPPFDTVTLRRSTIMRDIT